jgi:hypothetical protein
MWPFVSSGAVWGDRRKLAAVPDQAPSCPFALEPLECPSRLTAVPTAERRSPRDKRVAGYRLDH